LELIDSAVILVHLGFLGLDFFRKSGDGAIVKLPGHEASRIPILNLVEHECSIGTRREEEGIIVAEAHSLEGQSVCLNFVDLFETCLILTLFGILPYLNATRPSLFTNTSKKGVSLRHHLHLRQQIPVLHRVITRHQPHLPIITHSNSIRSTARDQTHARQVHSLHIPIFLYHSGPVILQML